MKKCFIFLIFALINIFLVILVILFPKEHFKENNINKRILINNRTEIKVENDRNQFFLKNYYITLFTYRELYYEFIHLISNYSSNNTL